MKRKVFYILAFCVYIAVVLVLCLIKPDDIPQPEIYIFGLPVDKVVHFLMFLPFPLLVYMMLFETTQRKWQEVLILIGGMALGLCAALGTEFLQSLTQYRSADIHDVYADMMGICLGGFLVLIYIVLRKNRN